MQSGPKGISDQCGGKGQAQHDVSSAYLLDTDPEGLVEWDTFFDELLYPIQNRRVEGRLFIA